MRISRMIEIIPYICRVVFDFQFIHLFLVAKLRTFFVSRFSKKVQSFMILMQS